ncbi:MAG TPA: hypothetical protein VG845_02000 [Dehalococcoidia bacterium]|nr:hypothetical protein [Dehalococcoidia bacterium]
MNQDQDQYVEGANEDLREGFKWHIGFFALVAIGFVVGIFVAFVV